MATTEQEAIEGLKSSIQDLTDVEPKSFGNDAQATEAASWLSFTKKTEADAEEMLGPSIKKAFEAHKTLTTARKKLLETLIAAKDRVRVNLANWIAGGHEVKGCYIQRKWKVTVEKQEDLPGEYLMTIPDQAKLDEWAATTEGKVAIPGCRIDQVNVLFAKETE